MKQMQPRLITQSLTRPWRLARSRRPLRPVRGKATANHLHGCAPRSGTMASGKTAMASCMTSVPAIAARSMRSHP
eukprot:11728672-Alexandrium_andersonii.AAC.1